jgi:dimethylamine monooxygenase subunit C
MKQPVFINGKRKYLYICDQAGYSLLKSLIDQTIQNNDPMELVFLGASSHYQEQADTNLKQWLISQKMGTYLYVALDWNQLSSIKSLAEQIGFSKEEAQFFGHGTKYKKVFCCRCHGLSEAMEAQTELECKHCKLELAISDHYSTLRDAYLGYILKL